MDYGSHDPEYIPFQMVDERKNDDDTLRMQALWGAVLDQALNDLVERRRYADRYNTSRVNLIRKQAYNWFFESAEMGVGSLFWVCDVLGLSPSYVRRAAMNIYHNETPKVRGEKRKG